MVNAVDVAEAITDEIGPIGAAKLVKLLYYAQGWSLAWTGEPIFDDPVQAWPKGPVVYRAWSEYNPATGRTITGNAESLSADQRQLLTAVVERYGNLTGAELIRMTHHEDPWQDTRGDLPPREHSNRQIPHEAMRQWFRRTSFEPETEDTAVDEGLADEVVAGRSGALADLTEQVTGVRPSEIRRI